MIEPNHPDLSIGTQCKLLSISRSSFYYEPKGETELNLGLMQKIDRQFLETPFYGVRQMTWHLRNEGHLVNEKRIRRLMRLGTRISMDGKGRFLDNIFVERLWRSLKYECVYLHAWKTGTEAQAGVRKWMEFYNQQRPHSALGSNIPAVVYWQRNETVQPDQQGQRVA